ncbi:MAG: ribonuclease III [Candidatus Colwellbacteria bacterium CG10_big_fil_rev_8_21_14_0_10_41_28]|uniref:Ribonuclease 3 n=1 Tax=Candidatus Colwellbacteria bacterium CG10_big_fil_rev_8_21_14_0_10_41_28 TaxID=1974539 RepID=A0A2H0VHG5_9BACT|nr:MAG: ribonuclease III [Candidatus Colwellbacteria bacterium CG10_big_fil_rev_8_21_14_0_10_41_28]
MTDFKELEKKIGITFKNKSFLEEALTHRSYLNENPSWKRDKNERLEFLGDAVLELVVTEHLFKTYPDTEEGTLTVMRAAVVNTKSLYEVAIEVGFDKALLLSKGEAKDVNSRGRETISANSVEAVIGAIYLDQGYKQAKKFIDKYITPKLDNIAEDGGKDPKSLVQEIAQAKYKITPSYEVLGESGPAHDRIFIVGLYFGEELKMKGEGSSKQEAELNAASHLLKFLED